MKKRKKYKDKILKRLAKNLKQVKNKDFDSFEKEITDGINSLKRLLTETPAVKETNPVISVKKRYCDLFAK
jgi:hypothetical protein